VAKDDSWARLALAWFRYHPLVSQLLLLFGCVLLIARPIFAVRLMCLGLSWDYFFRFQIVGIHKTEYHEGPAEKELSVEWSRLIGGIFFLSLAAAPSRYWLWIYHYLNT
jgi:hypothetical protein